MPQYSLAHGAAAVLAILALAAVGTAAAEEAPPPDPSTGEGLAKRLCSNCHLVGDGENSALPAGVPSMRGLANRPGQTGRRIENALIQPHPPMPDMRLTMQEIQHLLSYLETLRTNPEVAPLFTPPGQKKPSYPKPS